MVSLDSEGHELDLPGPKEMVGSVKGSVSHMRTPAVSDGKDLALDKELGTKHHFPNMQDESQQDGRLSPHSEAEIYGNVEGEDGSESEDDELEAKDANGLTLEELADKVKRSPPTRQWA